jgi:hypothetical protein
MVWFLETGLKRKAETPHASRYCPVRHVKERALVFVLQTKAHQPDPAN